MTFEMAFPNDFSEDCRTPSRLPIVRRVLQGCVADESVEGQLLIALQKVKPPEPPLYRTYMYHLLATRGSRPSRLFV